MSHSPLTLMFCHLINLLNYDTRHFMAMKDIFLFVQQNDPQSAQTILGHQYCINA